MRPGPSLSYPLDETGSLGLPLTHGHIEVDETIVVPLDGQGIFSLVLVAAHGTLSGHLLIVLGDELAVDGCVANEDGTFLHRVSPFTHPDLGLFLVL